MATHLKELVGKKNSWTLSVIQFSGALVFPMDDFYQVNQPVIRIVASPEFKKFTQ